MRFTLYNLSVLLFSNFKGTELHTGQNIRVNTDKLVGFEIFVLSYAN